MTGGGGKNDLAKIIPLNILQPLESVLLLGGGDLLCIVIFSSLEVFMTDMKWEAPHLLR
jgi:hypothetical protein